MLIGTNWPLPQLWLGGGHTYFIGWNNTCSKNQAAKNASHFKLNSINYITSLLKVSYLEHEIIFIDKTIHKTRSLESNTLYYITLKNETH